MEDGQPMGAVASVRTVFDALAEAERWSADEDARHSARAGGGRPGAAQPPGSHRQPRAAALSPEEVPIRAAGEGQHPAQPAAGARPSIPVRGAPGATSPPFGAGGRAARGVPCPEHRVGGGSQGHLRRRIGRRVPPVQGRGGAQPPQPPRELPIGGLPAPRADQRAPAGVHPQPGDVSDPDPGGGADHRGGLLRRRPRQHPRAVGHRPARGRPGPQRLARSPRWSAGLARCSGRAGDSTRQRGPAASSGPRP